MCERVGRHDLSIIGSNQGLIKTLNSYILLYRYMYKKNKIIMIIIAINNGPWRVLSCPSNVARQLRIYVRTRINSRSFISKLVAKKQRSGNGRRPESAEWGEY